MVFAHSQVSLVLFLSLTDTTSKRFPPISTQQYQCRDVPVATMPSASQNWDYSHFFNMQITTYHIRQHSELVELEWLRCHPLDRQHELAVSSVVHLVMGVATKTKVTDFDDQVLINPSTRRMWKITTLGLQQLLSYSWPHRHRESLFFIAQGNTTNKIIKIWPNGTSGRNTHGMLPISTMDSWRIVRCNFLTCRRAWLALEIYFPKDVHLPSQGYTMQR